MSHSIHLIDGAFYADILRDRHDRDIWVYVIQIQGSADILAVGMCSSEQAACETATIRMRELAAASGEALAS